MTKRNIFILIMLLLMAALATDCIFVNVAMAAIKNEPVVEYYIPVEPRANGILPEEVLEMRGAEKDICMLAQTVWGEARGLDDIEKTKVIWCIFNRVDSPRFANTVEEVITAPNQFIGYKPTNPVDERLYSLALDCYIHWMYEKSISGYGRTLEPDYLYFSGINGTNVYRKEF